MVARAESSRLAIRKAIHRTEQPRVRVAVCGATGRGHNSSVAELKSVLDRGLPRSQEAERKLDALRGQARDFGIACALSVVGTVVAVAIDPRLGLALAAAAVATGVLCFRAIYRRRELLSLMMSERDAYSIEAVRRRASRFATPERRHRLGAWVGKVVAVADGTQTPPSTTVRVLDARVKPRRERLLKLADAFNDDAREIHPTSIALLHQMLTRPGVSPLYNVGLEEDLLDLALHRVEAGIEPHA